MDEAMVHVNVPTSTLFSMYCGVENPNSQRFVTVVSATTLATCPACLEELAESLMLRANKYRKPDTRSIGLDNAR